MHKRTYQFTDEALPQHIEHPYTARVRKLVPSVEFERGLALRRAQDEREGYRSYDRDYFLKWDTIGKWNGYDALDSWAREHRGARNRGDDHDPDLLYTVNRLAAYSYTAGWRTVPGVRWCCDQVDRPDLAESFEHVIREFVRDADAIHRLLAKKPTAELLRDAGDNLIRPILADFRRALANVVAELHQYPELRGDLPEPVSILDWLQ